MRSLLSIKISYNEILLLTFTWIVGFAAIFFSGLDFAINSTLLLIFVSFFGLFLAKKTAISLGDYKLNILGTFWLLKVLATIMLLYLGWMPDLDYNTSSSWGYDPQRYYKYTSDLIENDWIPNFGLNYMGIIYYYAAIFSIFGYNPLIASLINIFVTLLGILFLIRCLYTFIPIRSSKDWSISFLLLIPEVLWYDVMTSRETLLAFLITTVSLIMGRKILAYKGEIYDSWFIAGFASLAILSVRATMIIPVLFGAILMFLILSKKSKLGFFSRYSNFIVLIGSIFIAVMAGPFIQAFLGTSTFNFASQITSLLSASENIASDIDGWSDRSIGLLLMPEGPVQALLFLPLRMILYLAAPLPNISVTILGLLSGSFSAWQNLMTIPTSMLMIILFPYVLSGSLFSWRIRAKIPGMLVVPIVLWVTMAAVAGGNLIIHERYRLMFTLLFFAVAWIGYTQCSSASVKRWSITWFTFIFSLFGFYFIYKFF
jgi:hypothetical protein